MKWTFNMACFNSIETDNHKIISHTNNIFRFVNVTIFGFTYTMLFKNPRDPVEFSHTYV